MSRVFWLFFAIFVFLVSGFFWGVRVKAQVNGINAPTLNAVVATSSCAVELYFNATTSVPSSATFDRRREISPGQWSFWAGPLVDKNSNTITGPGDHVAFISGFLPNETANYEVRTNVTGAGFSGPSNARSATTPPIPSPPALPTNFRTEAWASSTGPVRLSWQPDSNQTATATSGFRVYYSTDGVNFNVESTFSLNEFINNNYVWTDTISSDNGPHYYRIKTYQTDKYCFSNDVVDNNVAEQNNPKVSFSTGSTTLIIPPRPGNIVYHDLGSNSYKFSWPDVSGETRYDFQLSQYSNFSTFLFNEAYPADTTSSNVVPNLNPQTTYYYRLRACNDSGNGNVGCSDWRTSSFTASYPPPQNLKAFITYVDTTDTKKGKVLLRWDDTANFDRKIMIYRRESGTNNDFALLASSTGTCLPSGDCSYPTEYLDDTPDIFKSYDYQLTFSICKDFRCVGNNLPETGPSNAVTANLNILFVLRGVAWASAGSGSIGWIKFNSMPEENVSSTRPYSVQVDADGLMSGAAWAGDYGWLSFNEADLEGCPTPVNGKCQARLDPSTGQLSGWAKFIRASSFSSDATSWKGWVSLSGPSQVSALQSVFSPLASILNFKNYLPVLADLFETAKAQSPPPYGITYSSSTRAFSGAAWAEDVGGWIVFSSTTIGQNTYCLNCTVTVLNQAPSVSDVGIRVGPVLDEGGGYVGDGLWCAATPHYSISWEYTDPDQDPQKAAQIKFSRGPNDSNPVILDYDTSSSIAYSVNQNYVFNDPLGYADGVYNNDSSFLQTNTSYDIQVRVFDGLSWSDWSSPITTTTPSYYWPLVDFWWDPNPISVGGFARFNGIDGATSTKNRSPSGSSSTPLTGWQWDFHGLATPNNPSGPTSTVIFSQLPRNASSSLTVSDGSGKTCTLTRIISGSGTTPLKRRIFRERQF